MFLDFANNAIEKKQYTNIYLSEILIEDYLENIENNQEYDGISNSEIARRWSLKYNEGVYRKHFSPTYCHRRLEKRILTLNPDNNQYKINDTDEKLATLENRQLLTNLRDVINARNPVFDIIDQFTRINDKQSIFQLIEQKLTNGNSNDFEVMSYAILAIHLKSLGFSLKRFTGTNANDGGVDFIGGDIIYCVTTELSRIKLESDIKKTHASKVFIYKNLSGKTFQNTIDGYIQEGVITNMINNDTLINIYLNQILNQSDLYGIHIQLRDTIIREYEKEIF